MARSTEDKAQQFDRRITVSRRVETTDDLGTKDHTWSVHKILWAKRVTGSGGRQLFAAGQEHATVTDIFRVRYRTDLDATMRVTDEHGVHYDLAGPPVDVGGMHTITELRVTSNLGDGRPE
jgi:SPP1 family predicted phage head-tail adaptor